MQILQGAVMEKTLFILCSLIAIIVSGCSQNHFNVPTENFANRIKVLGVVPIIVDSNSDIIYPQKEQLISLLSEKNRAFESQFVRKLKATGNFYAVAMIGSEPDDFFKKMLFRREQRDDATIRYNKYFWKNDELKNYLQKNNLDAVMLIVISGLTQESKIFSSNFLNSLTSNYNFLTMSAQIIDSNSTVLWEYPNFRQRILTYQPMINLQYPDFSESDANKAPIINVKFKTIEGIRRALEIKKTDILLRDTQEPDVYGQQFDEIISLLKINIEKSSKGDIPGQQVVPPTVETGSNKPNASSNEAKPTSAQENKSYPIIQTPTPTVTRVPVIEPGAATSTIQTVPKIEVVPATSNTL